MTIKIGDEVEVLALFGVPVIDETEIIMATVDEISEANPKLGLLEAFYAKTMDGHVFCLNMEDENKLWRHRQVEN